MGFSLLTAPVFRCTVVHRRMDGWYPGQVQDPLALALQSSSLKLQWLRVCVLPIHHMVGVWEQWNCISRNPILAMLTLYILVMTLLLAAVTLASLAYHFDPHAQAWPVFEFSLTSSSVQEKLDKDAALKKSTEDTWCCSVPSTQFHPLSICGVCITFFLPFLSSLYKNARMKTPKSLR